MKTSKPKSVHVAVLFLTTLFLFSFSTLETATWKMDSVHSSLRFSATHFMVSDVGGTFDNVVSTLTTSKPDFSDAKVNVTIQVNSVKSGSDERDGHLKSGSFLDAEKYPTITFASTSFTKTKQENIYNVVGNLTIHGVTKPVSLKVTGKTGTNPMTQKTIGGFEISGSINRSDFNVGSTVPTAVVGEEIKIQANCEFIKD